MWLIIAIVLNRTDFVFAVFAWRGNSDPTLTLSLF